MSAPRGPVPQDDWRRRGQETVLKGAVLRRETYRAPSLDWDHDHCEFCIAKFSERPTDLAEGYTTADHYRWICEPCFKDFRDEFGFIVGNAVS